MTGRVALVTGASSGIGEATALELLKKGFTVYGSARRIERMSAIEARGVRVLAMDVTDDQSMIDGIGAILDEQGRIDILVNNAGYGSYGSLEEVPMSEAKYQFEVNIFGLARLTQLVLPSMRAQGSGRIINISSIGGRIWEPFGSWYHATKFAVEGLSDSLRVELEPFGIDVVVIQPGAIKTEWNRIAQENLLKVSGDGPYGAPARAYAQFLKSADEGKQSSPPEVVAQAIGKAATAVRPKTRYAVGGGAKPILAFKKFAPDRVFDRVIRRGMTP